MLEPRSLMSSICVTRISSARRRNTILICLAAGRTAVILLFYRSLRMTRSPKKMNSAQAKPVKHEARSINRIRRSVERLDANPQRRNPHLRQHLRARFKWHAPLFGQVIRRPDLCTKELPRAWALNWTQSQLSL